MTSNSGEIWTLFLAPFLGLPIPLLPIHILWIGLLIGGLSILGQAWAYGTGDGHWQTVVFTVLTFSQLVHALAIRSENDSLITIGLLSNRPLLGAVLLTLALQLAVIYTPVLNDIFRTEPPGPVELTVCLLLPLVVLLAVEIEKWLVRSGRIYRTG